MFYLFCEANKKLTKARKEQNTMKDEPRYELRWKIILVMIILTVAIVS